MSQLILRNIPDDVRKTIKKQAIDKGISMQQHILNIMIDYIEQYDKPRKTKKEESNENK
jgi:plasmid stability protein